jgi:hypothetical protein
MKYEFVSSFLLHPYLIVVGLDGLEPSTSRLSVVCSSQLSYRPSSVSTFRAWRRWLRLRLVYVASATPPHLSPRRLASHENPNPQFGFYQLLQLGQVRSHR